MQQVFHACTKFAYNAFHAYTLHTAKIVRLIWQHVISNVPHVLTSHKKGKTTVKHVLAPPPVAMPNRLIMACEEDIEKLQKSNPINSACLPYYLHRRACSTNQRVNYIPSSRSLHSVRTEKHTQSIHYYQTLTRARKIKHTFSSESQSVLQFLWSVVKEILTVFSST